MHAAFVSTLTRKASRLADSLDHTPLLRDVISGRASQRQYAEFLRSTWCYVRWSSRLLTATAAGLRRRGRYAGLAELLRSKADEESPHDRWLLDDLERCGARVDPTDSSPCSRAVEAYVTFNLALADAGSPAYLGAAYMLEGISFRRAGHAASQLRAHASIPGIERAVTFLEGHGEADIAHIETLTAALSVVDDETDQAEILTAADALALLYPRFFAADA